MLPPVNAFNDKWWSPGFLLALTNSIAEKDRGSVTFLNTLTYADELRNRKINLVTDVCLSVPVFTWKH